MSSRSLITLVVVTAIVLAAAWTISERRAPTTELTKADLFPNLIAQVNSVTHVDVQDAEHRTELVLEEDQWRIANRGGYPARFATVKQLVVGIAELKILETKTSEPERYTRLQVEAIDTAEAKSTQVTLKDAAGTVLANLIVGKTRSNNSPIAGVAALYVRKTGEAQALLVEGAISASADPRRWWDNNVTNIPSSRIRRISIRHTDTTQVDVERSGEPEDFLLQDIPAGQELKSSYTLTSMSGVLAGLNFDDVRARDAVEFPQEQTETTIVTFDGLVITATSAVAEGLSYTRFAAHFDAAAAMPVEQAVADASDASGVDMDAAATLPNIEEEAKELNTRLAAWTYVLPDYKLSQLTRRLEDLIQPIETAAASEAAPTQ